MAWRNWRMTQAISTFLSRKPKPVEIVLQSPRRVTTEATGTAADRQKSIIKRIGLAFTKSSGGGRDTFEGPEGFTFIEIERAYLTDSYIRQACDKYVDYMFKAGYDIVGKDTKAVEYIKTRLQCMAVATEKPTLEFLTEIAEDVIKFHNVFIIKARASNTYQYPANVTVNPVLAKKPVAGYFLLPVSTITIARSENGTVTKYQQKVSGKTDFEIATADMIHIAVDRPQGRAFGFPFLSQVLDDVKLLRQMEELADRMVYKNIFPLIVYTVGKDADGERATNDEITEVKEQLAELPLDGGVVIPERHSISAVGTGDKVIDASVYLEYFKKRVFTGLGVSATIMGEADTSNRSTSDNLDQMFKDRIKAYQRLIEENINSKIIYELLLEGGYDPLLDINDVVEFKFREIDLQAKMAEQNHIVQLFTQNAITHEQMRLLLGYDPITPEEENRLYFRMITIPTAVETAEATSAAQDAQAANNAGANKNQPTNQNGTRTAAKTKNSMSEGVFTNTQGNYLHSSLLNSYESVKADVIKQVNQHIRSGKETSEFDRKQIALICSLGAEHMGTISARYTGSAFIEGVSDAQTHAGKQSNVNITYNVGLENQSFKEKSTRLMEDLMNQVESSVKSSSKEDAVAKVVGAFGALQYRLKFISTTQLYGAYNSGFAKAARDLGYKEAYIESPETGCEVCGANAQKSIDLMSGKIPPFHPNCSCRLTLRKKEGSE